MSTPLSPPDLPFFKWQAKHQTQVQPKFFIHVFTFSNSLTYKNDERIGDELNEVRVNDASTSNARPPKVPQTTALHLAKAGRARLESALFLLIVLHMIELLTLRRQLLMPGS